MPSENYRYRLDTDYTIDLLAYFYSKSEHDIYFILSHGDFERPWLRLDGRRLTIPAGYCWDGCSPNRLLWSTYEGRMNPRTGKPALYYASLVHDALYQYLDELAPALGATPAEVRWAADRVFLQLAREANFEYALLYYLVVRAFGGWYHRRFTPSVSISMPVLLAAALVPMLATGCATRYIENKAVKAKMAMGYSVSEFDDRVLRAPEYLPQHLRIGMRADHAAWDEYPIQYTLANLVDYGLLPSAAIGGGIWAAKSIGGNNEESHTTTTYNNNGSVQNGGNNNTQTHTVDDHSGPGNNTTGGQP